VAHIGGVVVGVAGAVRGGVVVLRAWQLGGARQHVSQLGQPALHGHKRRFVCVVGKQSGWSAKIEALHSDSPAWRMMHPTRSG